MSPTPLHAMNPTGRFTDRAGDYAKFRPSYPAAAVDAILFGLREPERLTIADIGAGTGIFSRLLAERGTGVIAIEPNQAMREAAETHPRIQWRDGTAEATGLPQASVEVVTCAQAFHWVRQEEAVEEFARVLKPRGRLALLWNDRDRSDALMTEYRDAIRAAGGEHPAELREFDAAVVPAGGRFHPMRLTELPHTQVLDEDGLVGRVMSASYAPKEGAKADQLRARLREIHRRYRDAHGLITLRYITRVWLSERR